MQTESHSTSQQFGGTSLVLPTEPCVSEHEDCPHCRSGTETFRYMRGAYRFDVDLARKIVADGRVPIELDPEDVRYSVDMVRIYPQHLPHVDTRYPGIIAHVWGPGADDLWLQGHLLIDGHHRAARCLQLGLPYYVHILSQEESELVVIYGPVAHGQAKPKPSDVISRMPIHAT